MDYAFNPLSSDMMSHLIEKFPSLAHRKVTLQDALAAVCMITLS